MAKKTTADIISQRIKLFIKSAFVIFLLIKKFIAIIIMTITKLTPKAARTILSITFNLLFV